jgi:uncharacterized protein involved in response to NO
MMMLEASKIRVGKSCMATLQQRWRIFSAAPHRMFFATGLGWLLAWAAWWAALLAARAAGVGGLEPARPALLIHGATALFLAFVPFMYGFLLTVYPRWMPAPEPGRGAMLWAFGLVNAGNLLFFAGLWAPLAWSVAGWLLVMAALAVITATLLRMLLRAGTRVAHAHTVLAGTIAGLLGMLLFALALISGDFTAWPLVRGLGLWGLLLVVYFSVCHRMIPFFSSRVVPGYMAWRPDWILYLFVGLALARALLETAPTLAWLATVPMAGIALACALRWRPRARSEARLLHVLHISFAWLPIGLALAAAADLAFALGTPGLLGRAPLHALGLGFMGGMLVAMVTRVTLGHSGRPLALDRLTWRLFLAVQAAAGLRVAAEFLPHAAAWLSLLAALVWLAALLCWAVLNLPVYFRPRADGAPG